VSASTLKEIPIANDRNGLLAYHGISGIGIYSTHSKLKTLVDALPHFSETPVISMDPKDWGGMDPHKPTLYTWSEQELAAFGMEKAESAKAEGAAQTTPQSPPETTLEGKGPPKIPSQELPGADFLYNN
jgi:hypothetical protein